MLEPGLFEIKAEVLLHQFLVLTIADIQFFLKIKKKRRKEKEEGIMLNYVVDFVIIPTLL